ncbi:MAG TPA: hypothetical protein VGC64_09135, partial [Pyrinomonadaceae bacterium]
MGYLASHNPRNEPDRHERCGSVAINASPWIKLCGLACWLLSVAALWPPAPQARAQSGRQRTSQPAASPRQPSAQRQRRTSSTSSGDAAAPAQNKKPLPAATVDLPLTENPPPLPTPTPAQSATPAAKAGAETQEGDEVDAADVVRINSNLVTVPASVVDDLGRAVVDLKLEDFELRVDGQPKEISELGRSETPVHMVMLFDNSMSLSSARE